MDTSFFSIPIDHFYKPLSEVPTEEDYRINHVNRNPEHLTSRLHELVPLLKMVNFKLEEVTDNETSGGVPLLASTMNQNGTHQASIFYVMADYIAGTAIYAGLPGSYIVGLHDRSCGQPIQLWTKSVSLNHYKPGSGYIQGRAAMTDSQILNMRKILIQKGSYDIQLEVEFFQDDEKVAIATIVIGAYFDNPIIPSQKLDFFQRENSKLSAKLIAALRHDDFSKKISEQQGKALAERFSEITPQLPQLVEARGLNLNDHLDSEGGNYQQVVVLGIGLDPKPISYASPKQKWFGVDLFFMCKFRTESIQKYGGDPIDLKLVPGDLFNQSWDNDLRKEGFDPTKSTLFIIEGVSMYLQKADLSLLAEKIRGLSQSEINSVWIDHVTPEVYEMKEPEIRFFLSEISRLGEPFVTGFNKVEAFTGDLETISQHSAFDVLGETAGHPIYKNYLFSLIKLT